VKYAADAQKNVPPNLSHPVPEHGKDPTHPITMVPINGIMMRINALDIGMK
jgi:hypothetical protein